eukprot:39866_1
MATTNLCKQIEQNEQKQSEYSILNDPNRINVDFCMSVHNISSSNDSNELKFHLVLKFYYFKKDMNYFMDKDEIPNDDVELLKDYGSMKRFFPFMIFNAIEESPINWSYLNKQQNNTENRIYERIELYVTLTNVIFERYAPFTLKLLNIKIGTDGTFKAGLINLIPKEKNGQPQIDWGVFQKDTSSFVLNDNNNHISINEKDSNVFCKMFVRDLRVNSKGNLSGIYTRIYTCLFFELNWFEDLFKYVLVSTILMYLLVFTADLEVGDLLATNLTLILTEVALLFVLPPTDDFTTTERVLTAHILIMVIITILTASNALTEELMILYIVLAVTISTFMFVFYEYKKYHNLVEKVKKKFYSNGSQIGDYVPIAEYHRPSY